MSLISKIAFRYLFAKKSHNVINLISAISAIGMAIGSAALILILSVYNGFDRIVENNLSDLDPDVLIIPKEGKLFDIEDPCLDPLFEDNRISRLCAVLQDNVFINYDGKQAIALAKGVGESYIEDSNLENHFSEGSLRLYDGEIPLCSLGSTLAQSLGLHTWFTQPIELYYPKTDNNFPILIPSLHSERLWPVGIFNISSDTDSELIIIPYEVCSRLMGVKDGAASALELSLDKSIKAKQFIADLKLDGKYEALDRYEQHPSIYKMMKYEKLSVFLILIFVVIIIAFNIFGSMSMLIIEKQDDIASLSAMGATDKTIRRIFILEAWLISFSGLIFGIIIGVALALAQQYFGFVKMPAGFIVDSYPIVLKGMDVLWTSIVVAIIALIISILSIPKNR